jgi:3,4-dihydroxy 2-butanone 4-phosphate synthase/GTP cyclohydrolase II
MKEKRIQWQATRFFSAVASLALSRPEGGIQRFHPAQPFKAMSEFQLAPVQELIAEIAAGRMVVLVDDENRENEGDVIIAADKITPEAINFMARFCRGLICLTLSPERCDFLGLPPMVSRNGTKHGTAFTVSIEAATGIDTGISAADRARTVQVAVAVGTQASDLVQPGHVFPLRAAAGGVLMRAGHTEAGCDLAALAGLQPASVICEVMKDDGTMARLPDLVDFAKLHGIKLGSIADLIRYRSQNERLVRTVAQRPVATPYGDFNLHSYQDEFGGAHLALTLGQWNAQEQVMVRVHEPLSLMDWLDTANSPHSWPLSAALSAIRTEGKGVVLLLNPSESSDDLLRAASAPRTTKPAKPETGHDADLRTYGLGAQILRDLGISRMKVLGNPRRFPSMGAYGLVVEAFVSPY